MHSKLNLRSRKRSERGALASLLILALVLGAFLVTALAVDISHSVLVKSELQTACDAGALAGAQDLMKSTITSSDLVTANGDAAVVTSRNFAENQSVTYMTPGINVQVTVGEAAPYPVTVIATKRINNMFAALFGATNSQISAKATAVAQRIQSLNPGQALNLAVSLDWAPPKGPQAGKALNSYVGPDMAGQTFTIDLNSQQSKNSAWLKDWNDSNNPYLTFGQTVTPQNGVRGNYVQELKNGDTIVVPIINGGPPFNDSRTVLGGMGFQITDIITKYPQQITGTIVYPIALNGKPGTTVFSSTSAQDNLFLNTSQPWQVQLVE
jgi:Flp pilus assembly protein TadG